MTLENIAPQCNLKLWKDKNVVVTRDEKNLLRFIVGNDFYPTSYVYSIPEPWRGDRKHMTRWIKIISTHKA